MWVKEVPHPRVPPDQEKLIEGRALAAGLEQPEQSLDGDVHDRFRRLLAGREVQHVGDVDNGALGDLAILDGAGDDLETRADLELALMAEGAHREPRERGVA